jgi:hypothetical protein
MMRSFLVKFRDASKRKRPTKIIYFVGAALDSPARSAGFSDIS